MKAFTSRLVPLLGLLVLAGSSSAFADGTKPDTAPSSQAQDREEIRDLRRLEGEIEGRPETAETRQDLALIRADIAKAKARLKKSAPVKEEIRTDAASPEELSIKVYQNIGHGMVMLLGSYPDQKADQPQSSTRQESDKTLFPVIPISVAFPDGIAGGGIDFTSSPAK